MQKEKLFYTCEKCNSLFLTENDVDVITSIDDKNDEVCKREICKRCDTEVYETDLNYFIINDDYISNR